jgi:hypothetical protein
MKDIKNKVTKIIILMIITAPVIANEFVVAIDRDENNYIHIGTTSWVNEGVPYNCSNWTPDENLSDYGTNVEQERTCDQDQVGTQKTTEGTITHNQTIQIQEKQIVLGTYDYVVGTTTGSWSAWTTYDVNIHAATLYNCGGWVQYAEDSSYVYQRSLCKFDQTRTRTIYNDWLSGSQTVKTTETDTNTVNQYKYRKLVKAVPY